MADCLRHLAHRCPTTARFPVIPNSGISETSWGFHLTKRTIYSLRSPLPDQSSWIIKLDGDKMHLFNPLDRSQLKSSPKLFSFFDIGVRELVEDYALQHINFRPATGSIGEAENLYMEKVAVLNNGSGGFVLLTIHVSGKLAVHKSGDEIWRLIYGSLSPYDDVILWKGKFYAVDTTGQIVVVNTDDMNVSVAARSIFGGDKKLLVDCDGELLVVDMHLGLKLADDLGFNDGLEFYENFGSYTRETPVKFKVFRLDEQVRKWIKISDLGDTMLFLGDNCAFSASVGEGRRGGLMARCVGVFDLESGSIGPADGYSEIFWPPPDWVYSIASIEVRMNQMNI
ncbi:F-box protein SKIP23-like isoform X2 [Salvia divinorum]|uniref:F-box protein SKIP23-like isoform X2 n=1 Tax=Salvia divinorum TaxID=28513 RepID=A0ABD1HY95_SALDI